MGRELSLGTLFKGAVDGSFISAINQLKTILSNLNESLGAMGEATGRQRSHMRSLGSEFTALQLAAGRLTETNRKLGEGFMSMAERLGVRTGSSVKALERDFNRLEGAIQRQAMTMELAGKNGRFFEEHANRANLYLAEQAGRVKFAKEGFETLASAMHKSYGRSVTEAAGKIGDFQKALERASAQSANVADSLARGAKAFNAYSGVPLKNLETMIYRAKNAAVAHERTMIANGEAAQGWSKKVDLLNLGMDEAQRRLKYTKSGIEDYTDKMNKASVATAATETVLQRFGTVLKSMAYWGTAATMVYGFINAFKQGITTIIDFDQSMKNLQAITGSTNAEVVLMGKTILTISKNTRYSATEIASGMTLLAQAGLTATESIQAMGAAATLAQGTLEDMKPVTDLLTTTLESFSINAMDSGRVADVMAIAMNKSKLDVEKLRVAFGYLGPAASTAGISLEETAAATMLLSNAGLRASTIGTSFRQTISRLIAPHEQLRSAFISSGADMEKLNPLTNSLKDVLVELSHVVPNASKAFELFGLRAAPAVLTLIKAVKDGNTEFDEMLESTYYVGSASEMAAKQMEGLGSKTRSAANAAKAFAIALSEGGFGDVLATISDTFRALFSLLSDFSSTLIGKVTTSILGVTLTIGLFTKALKVLGAGGLVAAIISGLSRVGIALTSFRMLSIEARSALIAFNEVMITNPIGLIVLALTGLAAALMTVGRSFRKSADDNMALSIEAQRGEERLIALRNELSSTGEASNEYKRSIKELAREYAELAPLIDTVNGKWIDQQEGIKALDELIGKKHHEALNKAVLSLSNMQGQYLLSMDAAARFMTGIKSSNTVLVEYERLARGATGWLKEYGISVTSTLGEVTEALLLINPDIAKERAEEIAATILRVYKKMQDEQKTREEKAAAERERRERDIATGVLREVPTVYMDLYSELEGQRRADTELIKKKLDDDLDKIEKSIEQEEVSRKAGYARVVALHLDAIEKMSQDKWKNVGTQEDVNDEILAALRRFFTNMTNQYYNDRVIANREAKIKIEEAKGNKAKILQVQEDLMSKLLKMEEEYREKAKALWTDVWENRVNITKENRDKLLSEMRNVLTPTDHSMDIAPPLGIPFGAVTDEQQVKLAEKNVNEMLDILNKYKYGTRDYAAELKAAWDSATEAEQVALAQHVAIARSSLSMVGTPEQIARSASKLMRTALENYRKEIFEEQEGILRDRKDFINKQRALIDVEKSETFGAREKIMLDHKSKLLKFEEDVQSILNIIDQDWSKLQAAKGAKITLAGVGEIDISQFKTKEEAKLLIIKSTNEAKKRMELGLQEELLSKELETKAKKLRLEKQYVDSLSGITKDRQKIAMEVQEKEIEAEQWGQQQRLISVRSGGLEEIDITKKVEEMKASARKEGAKKTALLEMELQEKIIKGQESYFSQLAEGPASYAKAWSQLEKDLLEAQRWGLEQREINEKAGQELILDIDKKQIELRAGAWERYAKRIENLDKDILKKTLKQTEDELDAEIAKLKSIEYMRQVDVMSNDLSIEEKLQAEYVFAEKILQLYKDLYPKVKELYESGKLDPEEYSRFLKKILSTQDEHRATEQRLFEEKTRHLEDYYREGKIKTDDYLAYLKEAVRRNVLDVEEATTKIIAASGDAISQLGRGWQLATREAQTYGEFLIQLGKETREQFTDLLASFTLSAATGDKSMMTDVRTQISDWAKNKAKESLKVMFSDVMGKMGFESKKGINDIKLIGGSLPVFLTGTTVSALGTDITPSTDGGSVEKTTTEVSSFIEKLFGGEGGGFGSWFKNITEGIKSMFGGVSDWFGELFSGIGGSIQSLLGKIFAMISGSGSFDWTTAIIKAGVSAIAAGVGGYTGGGSGSGGWNYGYSNSSLSLGHSGGVLGVDALQKRNFIKAHRGWNVPTWLKNDEIPFIGKRGETILTPGQMGLLSKAASGNVNDVKITTIINATLPTGSGDPNKDQETMKKFSVDMRKVVETVVDNKIVKELRPGGRFNLRKEIK